jgi:hypothetical protein
MIDAAVEHPARSLAQRTVFLEQLPTPFELRAAA